MADEKTTGAPQPAAFGTGGVPSPAAVAERDPETIPKGKERGSQVPIAGGEPESDLAKAHDPAPNSDAQSEPALIDPHTGGSVSAGFVATPTGPVPVGAVTSDPKAAEKLLDAREKQLKQELAHPRASQKLTEAQVRRLGRADLAAVAASRGYDVARAGLQQMQDRFLEAQKEDASFKGRK